MEGQSGNVAWDGAKLDVNHLGKQFTECFIFFISSSAVKWQKSWLLTMREKPKKKLPNYDELPSGCSSFQQSGVEDVFLYVEKHGCCKSMNGYRQQNY